MIPANRRNTRAVRGVATVVDHTTQLATLDIGDGIPLEQVPVVGMAHPTTPGTVIVAEDDAWMIPAGSQIINATFGQHRLMRAVFQRYGAFTATHVGGADGTHLETWNGQPPSLPGAVPLKNNLVIATLPVPNPLTVFTSITLAEKPPSQAENNRSTVTAAWRRGGTAGTSSVRIVHTGDPTEPVHFFVDLLFFD